MFLTRRVFSALAVTTALALGACGGSNAPVEGQQTQFERAGDRGIGSADAPVTIVEYASVACGACAAFHEDIWPVLESEYIETGQVRFVLREMLTGSAELAMAGFQLAHCVPEENYFDTVDLLFQQQRAIFQAARTPRAARQQYLAIGRAFGVSEDAFNTCMNDVDMRNEILASHEQAGADGITGTPQFLINGQLLRSGRANGSAGPVYYLGSELLLIEGEPVPALLDEATLRRIIDHLVAGHAAGEAGAE